MKNFVLVALFIFLLVMVQFSNAQTIDDVIIRYETARGGKENLEGIKSIYMEGTRQSSDNAIPVRVIKEMNKLSRTEFEMPEGLGFFIITATAGWSFLPGINKTAMKIPENELAPLHPELDIAGPLINYAAKGYKAKLMGKDTLDETECYKIKLTSKTGKDILYWLDISSGLLVQSSQKMAVVNNGINSITEIRILYRNYKEVDGIKFPHTIETTAGPAAGILNFTSIELNRPVDPRMYELK